MKTIKPILPVLFVLMLFFAGCSSPPSNGGTTTTNADGTENTVGTTQAGGASTTARATSTTVAGSDNIVNDLLNLFSGASTDYMVVYNVKTSGIGNSTDNDITYYIKGLGKVRIDSSFILGGNVTESRIYMVDQVYTSCTKMTSAWSCMKITTPTQDPAETRQEMEDNIRKSTVTRIADRTIAGVNAKCYQVITNATNEAIYCVSNEGVALYSESRSNGFVSIMEAKSYRIGTADSDYVPPAEPTDLSGLLDGLGTDPSGMTEEELNALLEKYGAGSG